MKFHPFLGKQERRTCLRRHQGRGCARLGIGMLRVSEFPLSSDRLDVSMKKNREGSEGRIACLGKKPRVLC